MLAGVSQRPYTRHSGNRPCNTSKWAGTQVEAFIYKRRTALNIFQRGKVRMRKRRECEVHVFVRGQRVLTR